MHVFTLMNSGSKKMLHLVTWKRFIISDTKLTINILWPKYYISAQAVFFLVPTVVSERYAG